MTKTNDELEHKIARIISSFEHPFTKRTNGEKNEDADYIKRDERFKQIMALILADRKRIIDRFEAEAVGEDATCEKNHQNYKGWCSYCSYERDKSEARHDIRQRLDIIRKEETGDN